MDQVVVFQKMFEQVRKEQNFSWFYSELKHHRIAHYIYYLATDNIRIITHDDTVLLLRGTRNLLKVSTTKNPAKIKEAALLHICGKSTFREYCSTLAGAGLTLRKLMPYEVLELTFLIQEIRYRQVLKRKTLT